MKRKLSCEQCLVRADVLLQEAHSKVGIDPLVRANIAYARIVVHDVMVRMGMVQLVLDKEGEQEHA